ncbi:hypothetical protein G9A89_001373 [Geosiphon pyriformis]|nr:hypothetical protein G9A89_001373 [Geosiphon pyriformis]
MGNHHSLSVIRKKKSSDSLAKAKIAQDLANRYYIPSENEHIDMLQNQHFLYEHYWQCNFSSPIESMLNRGGVVIDVGCGPGTWILEMATNYPLTSFTGVDIVPIYPSEIMPKNAHFFQANILEGLPIKETYDFARISLLNICIPAKDWPGVIDEMIRLLKPGGWIEIVELDLVTSFVGPHFQNLAIAFRELLSKRGVDPYITQKLDSILAATNSLSKIQFDLRCMIPGKMGGQPGKLYVENLAIYFKLILAPHLQHFLNLTPNQYIRMWQECEAEFDKHESHINIYRYWGRKI